MALPKGNAIALQALRPLPELKVADLADNIIKNFQKEQAAKEQARLKALAEERKAIKEFTDKTQVKPFATISSITDQSSQLFRDTAEMIGNLGVLAEQDPSKKYEYQAKMQKIANNYNSLATTFGSPEFIKKTEEKLEQFKNQDYYLNSDTKERLELISAGMLKMQLDPNTGEVMFGLPQNKNSKPDEPAKWYTAGEVQNWYTKPEELDWINTTNANKGNTFPKEINDVAKVFGDEWSRNTDGNITKGWKGFAQKRASQWFEGRFGDYQANNIDPRLNQYSKQTFGTEIQSEEDFKRVRQGVLDMIEAQVPVKNTTDTKYTALQLEEMRLNNALKRKALLANDKADEPKYQIIDGGNITRKRGEGTYDLTDTSVIAMKGGKSIVGYNVPNKNGKGVHQEYAILGKDEYGRSVFEHPMQKSDAFAQIRAAGIDPLIFQTSVQSKQVSKKVNPRQKHNLGVIKYHQTYKPSDLLD